MFASRDRRCVPLQDSGLMHAMGMLDDIFLPRHGKVTFLGGDADLVDMLVHSLCSRASVRGAPVYWVDGGNVLDPHRLSRMMRRQGGNPRLALEWVHVSRAFTAHQMSTIVEERLETVIRENGRGMVLLPRLSSPYLDEDMDRSEAQHLLRSSMRCLQGLSRSLQVPVAVSAYSGRGRMQRIVRDGCDEEMLLCTDGGALRVDAPDGREALLPLAQGQTSLFSLPGR
ncbi:MAG: hypothetical protein AB7E27_01145 [Candidatus Methanomethylophilaceae archaeon]